MYVLTRKATSRVKASPLRSVLLHSWRQFSCLAANFGCFTSLNWSKSQVSGCSRPLEHGTCSRFPRPRCWLRRTKCWSSALTSDQTCSCRANQGCKYEKCKSIDKYRKCGRSKPIDSPVVDPNSFGRLQQAKSQRMSLNRPSGLWFRNLDSLFPAAAAYDPGVVNLHVP